MDSAEFSELMAFDPEVAGRRDLEKRVGQYGRLEAAAAAGRLACMAAIAALDDNGVTPEDVARAKTKCSTKAAKRSAKTATQLAKMPRTRAALTRGEIGAEHADALADAAERVSPDEADKALSGDAIRQPADRFAKQSRSWANARERIQDHNERHERRRAARTASSWTNADGMWCLRAELDPITGAEVTKALGMEIDRLWRADGGRDGTPDEIRTPDQRRADALANLLARTPVASTKRPPARHLVAVRVEADRVRSDDPEGVAELVDGTPLPQSVLERIACNAEFVGQIFDTDGAVLWQGRATRLATDQQWTALIARDGGCFCCGADPSHCEAHHVTPWAPPASGRTDIDDLVLVCTRTHHLIHDHGHQLTWVDGGWQLRPPEHRAPRRRPPPATGSVAA